ncbi:MAG: carbon-nitrogen hydrolase [Phototrophicales bacterium]|nr:MAG: carbon-nitrogen hydrolase [Phototrophicales bacterium]RMG73985.1 MAG: carbon-nitrogen family hydrolase [Chloroflexota bacterium]
MHIYLGDPKRNYYTMEKMTTEAANRGSHLVVFPELWSTGYALPQAKEFAHVLNAGLFAQVSGLAKQNKISITGSMLEKRGIEVANSASFFAPNGRMMGIYRKIHLFKLMDEDKYLQPGSSPLSMDLPWGKTALAICYDLRFPELFRRYALDDVTMVIIPAEWPLERIEHWRTLLIARAIENQCYMIGVNTVGQIGETVFGGHSMIVDPWGKIVVEAGETEQLITAEIELDLIDDVRKRIPVFEDRRPETYESIDLPF